MKKSLVLLAMMFVVLVSCSEVSDETGLESLDGFQWDYRPIIIFTNPSSVGEIENQLSAETPAIIDRDILWFIVADNAITTNYTGAIATSLADNLRQTYSQLETPIEVVLVGKDGGVKNRQPMLDSSAIYGQIDQMPMRQSEMREQNR